MGAIEALYIFDEHNNPLLSHTYRSRPPSASVLLPLYLSHPSPRPPLIYLSTTNPPSLVHSIIQDRLLFLAPTSTDTSPLLVLEFLHRVADALEEFLGSPLLASKIAGGYDIVAQLLNAMCDGGLVSATEPDPLREVVETPGWASKFLAGVTLPTLPGSSGTLGASAANPLTGGAISSLGSVSSSSVAGGLRKPEQQAALNIPWRRPNVRHTSNELYVDIVETLDVLLSPSGRPLRASSHGSIAFTSKVSGVPDLLLTLSAGGNKLSVAHTLKLPAFHPCVRLARWKERPGELSFVPPDGRFVLAGYEVDLLGADYLERAITDPSKARSELRLPVDVQVKTSLGPTGAEFEVRTEANERFSAGSFSASGSLSSSTASGSISQPSSFSSSRAAGPLASRPALGIGMSGAAAHPTVEDLLVSIPIPAGVRNIAELRATRGEATYASGDSCVEWRFGVKDVGAMSLKGGGAVLHAVVVGKDEGAGDDGADGGILDAGANSRGRYEYEYDDEGETEYQSSSYTASGALDSANSSSRAQQSSSLATSNATERNDKRIRQNRLLMPSSASLSFQVKGWLPSGVRVEKLVVDQARSRGLGQGVTPYKGVKYLTVCRGGVEVRC